VQLLEVVLDLGRIPIARFPSGDVRLSEDAVSHTDLEAAVALVLPSPMPFRPLLKLGNLLSTASLKWARHQILHLYSLGLLPVQIHSSMISPQLKILGDWNFCRWETLETTTGQASIVPCTGSAVCVTGTV
jgi:hypothetical protein